MRSAGELEEDGSGFRGGDAVDAEGVGYARGFGNVFGHAVGSVHELTQGLPPVLPGSPAQIYH